MYFNEKKYKNCIKNLIDIKTFFIISFTILFTCLGLCVGTYLMQHFLDKWYIITIPTGIGFIFGIIIGYISTWRIEMQIQEAYWKIDVINELKKQTLLSNKMTPIAKTVVAIENNSNPTNTPS